jgi:hypothetical protein
LSFLPGQIENHDDFTCPDNYVLLSRNLGGAVVDYGKDLATGKIIRLESKKDVFFSGSTGSFNLCVGSSSVIGCSDICEGKPHRLAQMPRPKSP